MTDSDDRYDPLVSLGIAIGVPIKQLQFDTENLLCNLKQAEVFPIKTSVITDAAFLDERPYREVTV